MVLRGLLVITVGLWFGLHTTALAQNTQTKAATEKAVDSTTPEKITPEGATTEEATTEGTTTEQPSGEDGTAPKETPTKEADAETGDAETDDTEKAAENAPSANIVEARYGGPVERYGHRVLGNTPEYSQLNLRLSDGTSKRLTLPRTRVFEDTTPRLVDLNQDGKTEVMVVESDLQKGARLAVYNSDGLMTATPFIGQRYRWLAPIGVADFNRDGQLDIAYVETPHLTGTVRIVTQDGEWLDQIAAARGLTNHRIDDTKIFGGIRDCGRGPEMILVKFPWRDGNNTPMVALELSHPDLRFNARPFPAPATQAALQAAMNCKLSPNY